MSHSCRRRSHAKHEHNSGFKAQTSKLPSTCAFEFTFARSLTRFCELECRELKACKLLDLALQQVLQLAPVLNGAHYTTISRNSSCSAASAAVSASLQAMV